MRSYRDNGVYLRAIKVSRSLTALPQSTHFGVEEKPRWKGALKRVDEGPQSHKYQNRP